MEGYNVKETEEKEMTRKAVLACAMKKYFLVPILIVGIVITAVSMISKRENKITIYQETDSSESDYSVSDSVTFYNDMFDLSPYVGNSGNSVAFFNVSTAACGAIEAYSLDPEIYGGPKGCYDVSEYSASDDAGQVILNYYCNYDDNELFLSKAGFYAVQLAVWGRIKKIDPASLVILEDISESQQELALRVRELASVLYNDRKNIVSRIDFFYGDLPLEDNYTLLLSDSEYIYFYQGHAYLRSEIIDLDEDGLSGEMHFTVNVDNGFVTDAAGNIVNTFGYGTENGTRFRVYTPVEENCTEATVFGSYGYTDVIMWKPADENSDISQKLISCENKNGTFGRIIMFKHKPYSYSELLEMYP